MSLSWLVVGGGIHGVHIAARLIGAGGVAREQLRILDPAADLLASWRRCAAAAGMKYLRSPAVHHLGLDPWSLRRFAGNHKNRKSGQFAAPYGRPSLSLFNAHCEHVIERNDLRALHLRERAEACTVDEDGVTVRTTSGQNLAAERVVLAIGMSDQLAWPRWAPRNTTHVQHVFDPACDLSAEAPRHVAVIGGGISAAQVALRLAREGRRVHLIARHPLRQHQFDSDPGWLGPKFMTGFEREASPERRRAMISKARHRGSVPPDVHRALSTAIARSSILSQEAEVGTLLQGQAALQLRLSNGAQLDVERVLLATGFDSRRPGGPMLDELIETAALRCAPCGYPVVDAALRWHPRIHVTGPLAELEVGPSSRNIAGAQRASERIVSLLLSPRAPQGVRHTGDTAPGGFSAPEQH